MYKYRYRISIQSTEYIYHICTEYRVHIPYMYRVCRVQMPYLYSSTNTYTIYVQRTEYKIPNMYRVQSTDAIYVQCTVRYCIYSSKVHTLATLLYRRGTVQVTNWYLELRITKLYIYILTLYHVERK